MAINGAAASKDRIRAPADQERLPFSMSRESLRLFKDTDDDVAPCGPDNSTRDGDRASVRAGPGGDQGCHDLLVEAVIGLVEGIGEGISGINNRVDRV